MFLLSLSPLLQVSKKMLVPLLKYTGLHVFKNFSPASQLHSPYSPRPNLSPHLQVPGFLILLPLSPSQSTHPALPRGLLSFLAFKIGSLLPLPHCLDPNKVGMKRELFVFRSDAQHGPQQFKCREAVGLSKKGVMYGVDKIY